MADQMAASALPIYGPADPGANISWLAERGVVFDAAYCPSPLCAPGRASFMSGLLPSHTVSTTTPRNFDPTCRHSRTLRRVGYRTVLSGKMHFVGLTSCTASRSGWTTDIYPATTAGRPTGTPR